MMRLLAVLTACATLASCASTSQPLDGASTALEQRLENALRLQQRAFETGSSEAAYMSGLWFMQAGDLISAQSMFESAADAGHPGAMGELAGVEPGPGPHIRNHAHAERWLAAAVEAGHVPAMVALVNQGGASPTDFGDAYPNAQLLASQRSSDARAIERIPPRTPANGDSGECRVQFAVDSHGRTAFPHVLECGSQALAAASLRAVALWRYEPKLIDGVPVWRSGVETTLNFQPRRLY